jgi:hypothetical protein
MWGALSDKRTDLSFTIDAGSRQRSHSRIPVPWYSWPGFTVSDSRLLFSSPPTTLRATVEVFEPASTRGFTVSDSRFPFSSPPTTRRRTECRSPPQSVRLLLRLFVVMDACFGEPLPKNGPFRVHFYRVNVLTEPLSNNGHILHNIFTTRHLLSAYH